MSGTSGMVLEALADASLRAALVAAFVAAVLAALRVPAGATRHAAWTVVLVAMLLMPALSRLVPAVGVPVPPAARDVVAAAVAATPGPRTEWNPAATAPPPLTPPRREPGVPRDAAPAAPSRGEWSWTATALAVYVAGLAPMLLRLVLGLWGSRRLARSARPPEGPARRRLGALPFQVLESDRIAVPVTVGLLRPSVVLPSGWERWSETKLQAPCSRTRARTSQGAIPSWRGSPR